MASDRLRFLPVGGIGNDDRDEELTTVMLTFRPYIPLMLWVPLALVTVALLVAYGVASRGRLTPSRWWKVIALMSTVVTIPLILLLNPTWVRTAPPPEGKPVLTVLIDRSPSMATTDEEGGKSRLQLAIEAATILGEELGDKYDVRYRAFADESIEIASSEIASLAPTGESTDLAAALERELAEDHPRGHAVLTLSDGVQTAGAGPRRIREAATKASAMSVPVFSRTIGKETSVSDLDVRLNLAQELAFLGQRVPVVVRLSQSGNIAPTAKLTVSKDGEEVLRREVSLVADGSTEQTVYVEEETIGLHRYEVNVSPLDGEATELNNSAVLLLRVVDRPVRVLLLEGKPYWDTKFLVRTLSRDRLVELDSVVQMAQGRLHFRRIRQAPGVTTPSVASDVADDDKEEAPATTDTAENKAAAESTADHKPPTTAVRSDEWGTFESFEQILRDKSSLDDYQIIVLGRGADVFLSDDILAQVKKWVGSGKGSLVCFRGPPAARIGQRLGALMPVEWSPSPESRYRVELTAAGRDLHWLPTPDTGDAVLGAMPPLASVTRPGQPKTLTRVLAVSTVESDDPLPVITYRPQGEGRVVVIEGAGMWRWAFLPPQHKQKDELFGMLWRSLTRWLVANIGLLPEQKWALKTDRVTFHTTEAAAATLLVRVDVGDEESTNATGNVHRVILTGDSLPEPRTINAMELGNSPGLFHVPFGKLPEGKYFARLADASEEDADAVTSFDVRGNLRERLEVKAKPELMSAVSETTGVTAWTGDDPQVLAQAFDEQLAKSRPERTTRTTAWDRWWVLIGALAVCAVTWGLRRWSGLV
jgi:hypothetical protein